MSDATGDLRLLRLFVASYAPLAAILAIQHSDALTPIDEQLDFWILAALAGWGLIDAYRLPRGAQRKAHVRVRLADAADEGGQVAAYIATYLLPFIGLALSSWRDVLALALYFVVLFVVFVRSDLALVNPALYVTGWRVVSGIRGEERVLMLIPKDVSVPREEFYAVTFGRFLVFDSEVGT